MPSLRCCALALSSRGKHPHCSGFPCRGAQALEHAGWWLWCTGLVVPRHVGSSQTRDRTCVPCIGRRILNHWTTREVPTCLCGAEAEHRCAGRPLGSLPPCQPLLWGSFIQLPGFVVSDPVGKSTGKMSPPPLGQLACVSTRPFLQVILVN